MTNPMDQDSGEQADLRQTLLERIDQHLEDGVPVFDENGEKVGNVKMYSTRAGYLVVGSSFFEETDIYIPFRLIRNIVPDEIFVSASKETLATQYAQPPQTQTIVETLLVAGPGGSMPPETREVQVLQSGYDDAPVELNAVPLPSVTDRLAVGMVVYDSNGERLGDITDYDTTRGLLVVEKGIFKPRAFSVPLSSIKEIDLDTFTVYLSMPEDALGREQSILPTNG